MIILTISRIPTTKSRVTTTPVNNLLTPENSINHPNNGRHPNDTTESADDKADRKPKTPATKARAAGRRPLARSPSGAAPSAADDSLRRARRCNRWAKSDDEANAEHDDPRLCRVVP